MREQYIRTGEGFLLVYSVTSRSSFEEIVQFHRQILRAKDIDRFPGIIVGNKSDLENERQVSTLDGEQLSKALGCPFIETSAKQRINVEEAFYGLVRQIKFFEQDEALQQQAEDEARAQQLQQAQLAQAQLEASENKADQSTINNQKSFNISPTNTQQQQIQNQQSSYQQQGYQQQGYPQNYQPSSQAPPAVPLPSVPDINQNSSSSSTERSQPTYYQSNSNSHNNNPHTKERLNDTDSDDEINEVDDIRVVKTSIEKQRPSSSPRPIRNKVESPPELKKKKGCCVIV